MKKDKINELKVAILNEPGRPTGLTRLRQVLDTIYYSATTFFILVITIFLICFAFDRALAVDISSSTQFADSGNGSIDIQSSMNDVRAMDEITTTKKYHLDIRGTSVGGGVFETHFNEVSAGTDMVFDGTPETDVTYTEKAEGTVNSAAGLNSSTVLGSARLNNVKKFRSEYIQNGNDGQFNLTSEFASGQIGGRYIGQTSVGKDIVTNGYSIDVTGNIEKFDFEVMDKFQAPESNSGPFDDFEDMQGICPWQSE
jgi:hypothetical protein